jgi:hypothetical protein
MNYRLLPSCGLSVVCDVGVLGGEIGLVIDIEDICGWKNGCPKFPFCEGTFVTWNGVKRIGGM